uniref:WW domain-containing protein n=1 Tax=Alexandrium catenella TaxID=2925 RepID=A0A7S1Q9C9_ALECA
MAQNEQSVESVQKITEKSEKARRDFFKTVEKLIKSHGHSDKLMQDTADRAAQEYSKVFGRIGVHPLLHLKGGKKPPRYVIDRDEVWVIYKPPVWKMGGSPDSWRRNVEALVKTSNSLGGAQGTLIASDREETLQEWHGLTQGMMWIDQDEPTDTRWGFIQRLDVETDGPVIIAKTWRAQRCLQVQMKEHVFNKAYMCLVHGRMENRIQHVKCRFAELGSDAMTQVMLKYDNENDPFYDWSSSGRWKGRSVRMAETFVKPMAYYFRKEDGTEYTLVYVNILTGITHQVRITLQSLGHPLVSDDRYLPKDQALSDLKWCPRNFLVEVRSDWFDMCGPYKDEERRRYTRISMENPLPKLLQNKLDMLLLVEKLDPTADLHQGCQYWNIGDEQLMNAYQKDDEYRRKVMRWGQRRGIHLDALDRLLLLPKEEIDDILQNYRSPKDKADPTWVCPKCMGFNQPDRRSANAVTCNGYLGKDCDGSRICEEDMQLPRGWMDYGADPTVHFLMIINPKYLDARRKVLKFARPSWEKPPVEPEGSPCTEDILQVLEAALVLNAKAGGNGIAEEDLPAVPGLENIKLPLACPPEDSVIQRCRLPGRGTCAQWTYVLKGKERIKHVADYSCKTKKLLAPIPVKTDPLPDKLILTKGEKEKKLKREREAEEEEKAKEDRIKEEMGESVDAGKSAKGKWTKKESTSNPGNFYYVNSETSETRVDKPPGFVEAPVVWERIEAKSNKGQFYYHNKDTGETRVDRPSGVEVLNDVSSKGKSQSRKKEDDSDDEGIAWERKESSSKPGNFYYFNPKTGSNEIHPPRVELPWKLLESKSKKGQFYYFNEDTGESDVHPPTSARPATKVGADALERGLKRPRGDGDEARNVAARSEKLPSGWAKKESDKYKGKFYYMNAKTGETSWTRPSEWERQESKSNPGTYYYVNSTTGETSWDKKVMNGK